VKPLILFVILALLFAERLHAQKNPVIQTDTVSGWQVVYTYPNAIPGYSVAALQFPSKDTGYAGVYNGTNIVLLRSTNSGIQWDTMPTPLPGDFIFTTPLIGYSTAHDPTDKRMWKTTDGGFTWVAYDRKSIASGPLAFANSDTGVIFGFTQTARTTDGGLTWTELSEAIGLTPDAASFGDSKTGYAVGELINCPPDPQYPQSAYCEKTTDGGASWTQICTGIPNVINSCYSLDDNTLIVCGGSLIGRTTDGGQNWQRVVDPKQIIGYGVAVSFAGKAHGLVVGSDNHDHGEVYSTLDSGKTWKQQILPLNTHLINSVAVLDDSVALFCSNNIYRTMTGGNFSSVPKQPTPDFQVQVFPNPTSGAITIQYNLPSTASVSFTLTDERGAIIQRVSPRLQDAGEHRMPFDGSALANGVYYVTLSTSQGSETSKFTVEK
jgi:photosystem II stability/assembly factor-like uncharacterized protein